MKFGLLLPHFGEQASAGNVLDGAKRAEELGFDSLWVRDHAVFEPHGGLEGSSQVFYEALTTLSAVGAVTRTVTLGTGSLIPTRHPIQTASIVSTITNLVGPRLVLGIGTGNFEAEFAALGLGGINRSDLVAETVSILRELWAGEEVSRTNGHIQFERVALQPRPVGGTVPIWYCGNAPASVRRAIAFADGWMPGRISLATFRSRLGLMADLAESVGRAMPTVGVIPPTLIDESRERALAAVNVEGHLAWANKVKYWAQPASGNFSTLEDIEGALIVGTPDYVSGECEKFREAGCDHLVFDLRADFSRWFEQLELLGTQVLPNFQ